MGGKGGLGIDATKPTFLELSLCTCAELPGCRCGVLRDQLHPGVQLRRESGIYLWWLLSLYLLDGGKSMDVRQSR